ncbi:MAG: cytochrome c [Deltaproteobacteria bacterium]|nr:cytochrome c [Deltaproteobacteria bacterium]
MVKALTAVLFFGLVWASGSAAFAQDDYLARRQNFMKNFSAESKAVKAAVEKKDYATIGVKAKDIAGGLELASFAKHWPHGTADVGSKAKPEIWTNWNDFMASALDGQKKALALASAANSKNEVQVDDAYKAFGQICGNCHKPYRAEKAR